MIKTTIALSLVLSFSNVDIEPNHSPIKIEHLNYTDESGLEQILTISKQYLGTPYVWGGSTPKGFDCSGFVQHVYNELGIELPRNSRAMYLVGTHVNKNELKVGDLVFFKYGGRLGHVGIYIGHGKMIHSANQGVKVDSFEESTYWKTRYVGAKRITN